MMKPSLHECSVLSLVLLIACSTSDSGGLGGNHSAQSTGTSQNNGRIVIGNVGGNRSAATIPTASTDSGAAASDGSSASTATGSRSGVAATSSDFGGGGGDSSTDNPNEPVADAGVTYDPPAPVGDTSDPPVGDTGDPPVGDTGDPPVGDTGDPPVGDTGDPPIGDTGDPPDGCTMTEIDRVNVIIFGNAKPSGADVEGKMWVGGNATFQGYGIASNDLGAKGKDCSEYTLVVGGDLAGQVNAGAGLVAVYGKNLATNLTARCGVTKERPVDFKAIETKLKGYSAAFKNYEANGTVSSNNSALTLTGKNKELNVFNVTGAQLKTAEIKISVPAGSSVVVNVSGKDVYFGGLGFSLPSGASCRGGTSDWCHRILWNFYEATSLEMAGIGVQGSVMAPYAVISGSGGNVDGQLIAAELTGGIEYHPYFFSGCLLLPDKP